MIKQQETDPIDTVDSATFSTLDMSRRIPNSSAYSGPRACDIIPDDSVFMTNAETSTFQEY